MSETWHGKKWMIECPDDLLTPMIRKDGRRFFINELMLCQNGQWFIPERYFKHKEDNGNSWAIGRDVSLEEVSHMIIAVFVPNVPAGWIANRAGPMS